MAIQPPPLRDVDGSGYISAQQLTWIDWLTRIFLSAQLTADLAVLIANIDDNQRTGLIDAIRDLQGAGLESQPDRAAQFAQALEMALAALLTPTGEGRGLEAIAELRTALAAVSGPSGQGLREIAELANRAASPDGPNLQCFAAISDLEALVASIDTNVRPSIVPVIEDTHANRASYDAAGYPDWFYYETDTQLTYLSVAGFWTYQSGTMTGLLASLPGGLGTHDAGLPFAVSDYGHLLAWSGTAWAWGPGEPGSGQISGFLVDPTGAGWHLCDGTAAVPYLKPDGTTGTQDLPDLVSVAGDAAYPKLGSPATGLAVAASAPTFTGGVGANTGSAVTGVTLPTNTGAPSATVPIPQGTGAPVTAAGAAHTHTEGSVTDPGHIHSIAATGTISSTGEPRHLVLRPWFRQ